MTTDNLGIDAQKWAAKFVQLNPVADEGVMISWFANAIEAGRDAGRREKCQHPFNSLFAAGGTFICRSCGQGLILS